MVYTLTSRGKSSLSHIHRCQDNSLHELDRRAELFGDTNMQVQHVHKKKEEKKNENIHAHTHKQWESIGVYHSWTRLMSRLLFDVDDAQHVR